MEEQLARYLEHNHREVVGFRLHPPFEDTIVRREPVNRCYVFLPGQKVEFLDISEGCYDRLYIKYFSNLFNYEI